MPRQTDRGGGGGGGRGEGGGGEGEGEGDGGGGGGEGGGGGGGGAEAVVVGVTIGKAVEQATGETIQTNEADKQKRIGDEREASTLGQRKRVSKHECTTVRRTRVRVCECMSVRVCECASVRRRRRAA